METIEVKLMPIKELFHGDNGYRILSCVPTEENEQLELNKYNNFTICGNDINSLELRNEYFLNLRKDEKSKYPASYIMVSFAGITVDEHPTVDPTYHYNFLCQFMEPSIARSIDETCPQFTQMILDGKEKEINYKPIKGVGPVRFASYVDKVKEHCSYLKYFPICSDWGIIDQKYIEKLVRLFGSPDNLKRELQNNPYTIFFSILEMPFAKADRIVLEHRPDLRHSNERAELGLLEILRQNEVEGDTRIDGELLIELANELIPECEDLIENVAYNSEKIHYDSETGDMSKQITYDAEAKIAEELLNRIHNPEKMGMDWEKFRKVDNFECTDEQAEILRLVNENKACMLRGGAGCVDADTEFFDGYGWKRIADYQEGDKVLQYNKDGTAELVTPWRYIKEPCDKMYHFETKKSVNQTLTDDHRILYVNKGHENILETNVLELKNKSENNIVWQGKFLTNFHKEGKGIPLTDEQIRVMVCVMAEGHFDKGCPHSKRVHIRLKKQRKRDRLVKLLNEANIPYDYRYSEKDDVHIYKFYAPERRKVYGDYWWDVNTEQSKLIEEEVVNWDGSIINSRVTNKKKPAFRTTEKKSADYIQFIFCNNGWQATIKINSKKREKPVYLVTTSHTKLASLCFDTRPTKTKTKFEEVVPSDGFKYCFTVPSHMLVLRRGDCIFITGNCGKSSAMKALVLMLEHYQQDYILLAPTGIASKRLRETTGRYASTIHMFLAHHKEGKIYNSVVLIDEASIMGVNLLADLLSVLDESCRIVFICDEAQLASISCGNVVQDIIDSGVLPTATLTKVFRYGSSGLATIATDTRNGNLGPRANSKFDDYKFYPIEKDPVKQIVELYGELLNEGYTKDEILVLCPFNKGKHGTYVINNAIQERFNKHPDTKAGYEIKGQTKIMFKVGDKVLNTKNNYDMPCYDFEDDGEAVESIKTMFVANGDIGYVRGVHETADGMELEVEFDTDIACVKGDNINHLLLGYAESIHKCQGSEAKAVVMFTSNAHKRMLSKNLLYVGDSRAKEKLIEVGDIEAIEAGLEVEENKDRDTYLKEMLVNS